MIAFLVETGYVCSGESVWHAFCTPKSAQICSKHLNITPFLQVPGRTATSGRQQITSGSSSRVIILPETKTGGKHLVSKTHCQNNSNQIMSATRPSVVETAHCRPCIRLDNCFRKPTWKPVSGGAQGSGCHSQLPTSGQNSNASATQVVIANHNLPPEATRAKTRCRKPLAASSAHQLPSATTRATPAKRWGST